MRGFWNMDRKIHVRAQIYGHRSGNLLDRPRRPHRQDLAEGEGTGPCRGSPCSGDDIGVSDIAAACRQILLTPVPRTKIMLARQVARQWRQGLLDRRFDVAMPDAPARPAAPVLLPANRMPKRGRAGSQRARIAMLHALAHIEYGAIDLAFDIVGRFAMQMPAAFIDDWIKVGADEALHFALLMRRLEALGSCYGALPAHEGLWEAAQATSHDVLARLAIVPMILEARGLDVTPA